MLWRQGHVFYRWRQTVWRHRDFLLTCACNGRPSVGSTRAHARCEITPAGATNVIDITATLVAAALARWPPRSATYSCKAIMVCLWVERSVTFRSSFHKTFIVSVTLWQSFAVEWRQKWAFAPIGLLHRMRGLYAVGFRRMGFLNEHLFFHQTTGRNSISSKENSNRDRRWDFVVIVRFCRGSTGTEFAADRHNSIEFIPLF